MEAVAQREAATTKTGTPLLLRKAAVLGAGTMGSRIAAHLANAGVSVLLLDLPGTEGARNAVADKAMDAEEEQACGVLRAGRRRSHLHWQLRGRSAASR